MANRTMMSYADGRKAFSGYLAVVMVALAWLAVGCNSESPKTTEHKPPIGQQNEKATSNTAPPIDLNCVMNHIQNPPESFHYRFKNESSDPWAEEADVTPQRIDGSFSNSSLPAPQQFHGTPQEVSSNLMAIGQMSSIFATVRNTSAVVNEGTEGGVNGYSTVKYSIDTAHGTPTERALYKSVLGPGGSEKGTVWVTLQGCPVRILLDEELHSKDGNVLGNAHYEEAMVRK
jgi:hypothetical protein